MTINIATAITVILSFAAMSQAFAETVKAPSLFANGVAEITDIKLEANEISALMLLEGVLDISSAAVLAGGCQSVEAHYAIEVNADGAVNKPESNSAKISSSENPVPLLFNATIEQRRDFFGQNFNIVQTQKSKLKDTPISEYSANLTVNHELTLLSLYSKSNIQGQNNNANAHQNLLIKNFYQEQAPDNPNLYLYGWGAESSSIAGYPANLAWIRLKALRTQGQFKRLALLADRLLGASACRIAIDSSVEPKVGNEKGNPGSLTLKGSMVITRASGHEEDLKEFAF
ncbi:hypothetical protein NP603_06900 [Methylomonas sp. SURF-1]|uniref:Uncharacterized protein n=1 Tax=Methylomonas aurea TaxID=2952224 RepID=A0ABT1UGJ7_9GAMM|nr:hypothetical protein [Methylomonas sp. SURF-1]MCQ8180829.1 hypothetical protein [Methylomonas sp. SURF-1]